MVREAADERLVVAEAAVAAHLHEVGGDELEVIERVGPRRVTHDLHALPGAEVGVNLPARLGQLGLQRLQFRERTGGVFLRPFPERGDGLFQLNDRLLEFEGGQLHAGRGQAEECADTEGKDQFDLAPAVGSRAAPLLALRIAPTGRCCWVPKSKQGRAQGSSNPDPQEEELAREHSSPRAVVIHEIIREDGEQELERTVSALVLSGLAAGLSMGFSFLVQALLATQLAAVGVTGDWRIFTCLGYSVGFVFTVLGRQQLFTETTLTAVLPLFTRRDLATLFLTSRLWAIVLTVNLLGTWLFALMLLLKSIVAPPVTLQLQTLAGSAIHYSFAETFLKAIVAGWLIALMVWILPSTRSARLLTIIIITYIVALGGFVHIVAGSTEFAYAVLSGMTSVGRYFTGFLVPTLLGNVVGGVALVSMLNHGSIAPEIGKRRK